MFHSQACVCKGVSVNVSYSKHRKSTWTKAKAGPMGHRERMDRAFRGSFPRDLMRVRLHGGEGWCCVVPGCSIEQVATF